MSATPADPSLEERICGEIRRDGPISFARFMELALYDPRGGYYTQESERFGPAGDFFTAVDAGHAFGRCLARQLDEIDRRTEGFDPFHVVEFAAGRGLLARDVVDAASADHPGLASKLCYWMVDRSPHLREQAANTVPEAETVGPEALGRVGSGCVVAVELFDALPVHRIRNVAGERVEVRVGLDPTGRLVDVEAEPSAELIAHAVSSGAAAIDGSEAELCLGAQAQLAKMADCLDRGVILIVDYGERAPDLYRRHDGTLLAYHRHGTNQSYLEGVGEQDLTSHVDFSALESAAEDIGLRVLGMTTQDRFLIANGIIEEFEQEAAAASRDPSRVKRRLQAMQLIHPESMGRRFKVLVLAKGCPALQLDGLRDPFAR